MNLLQIKNYKLEILPEIYALTPFKKIWDKDKTKDKGKAVATIAYIYYMYDYRSDFMTILLPEERHHEVVRYVFGNEADVEFEKITEDLTDAIDIYRRSQDSLTMQLYEAAKLGIEKIKNYITTIDLTERDEKNKPIHNVSSLNKMIQELGTTVEAIEKLEDKVKRDIQAKTSNVRGGKEKAIFEDGAI
jgi:hypothetical protein